ncbi:hypothetical protein CO659_14725 [Rhizobium sp. S9]|nr:hypothetical protein CO659_14725 [Rhizobium sp. S9]
MGDDVEQREGDASKHHENGAGNGAGTRHCKGILIHVFHPELQRRASFQTRKGRCSAFNCCIISSLNRFRFEELCRRPT